MNPTHYRPARTVLDDLLLADERTLLFNPLGLGGRLTPDDAAEFQAANIADAVLAASVPEEVLANFERARRMYLNGVLDYEMFTVAADLCVQALEGALRTRFVEYYSSGLPVVRKGKADVLTVTTFDDVRAARGYRLRRSDGSLHQLPTGAGALLAWARREKLLPGRRSRILDNSLADRRNDAAHPVRHTVRMPPAAAQTIRDVAEYINQLWGQATPSGRVFPAPIKRIARVAAVAPDGSAAIQLRLDQLRQVDAAARGWLYQVVLASSGEELISVRGGMRFAHVPGFQTTSVPCEELWRGGHDDLVALVDAGRLVRRGDAVDTLDRLFFIRKAGGTLDDARSPADLLALGALPPGHWHAITADSPLDAWCHVRDHSDDETEAGDECPKCFVSVDGEFTDPADVIEIARERCASSMT